MSYHLAVGVAHPIHHDSLGYARVGANAAEIVSKTMQAAILEAFFVVQRLRKSVCQLFDNVTNQKVADRIRFETTAARFMENIFALLRNGTQHVD